MGNRAEHCDHCDIYPVKPETSPSAINISTLFHQTCSEINPDLFAHYSHPLVIVGGHATFSEKVNEHFLNSGLPDNFDPFCPDSWVLQDFQEPWETRIYVQHILAAIAITHRCPHAKACFSGGYTRKGTPWSEADTYTLLAQWSLKQLLPKNQSAQQTILSQIFPESASTDTQTNLTYSLAQYHTLHHHLPDCVAVVSWSFKEERFRSLHFPSIEQTFGLLPHQLVFIPLGTMLDPEAEKFHKDRNAWLANCYKRHDTRAVMALRDPCRVSLPV